ncbi:hypothetical protein VMCG_02828 [Cytospora schulzeri]|uniref:Uncharacterized protein n=1 Tax=Cytospora schulzeri TaxID=448051 RepID=A0A423WZB7_9PEZI|nr:hypothetical protein VMCG_02828 [Valsa malicola]
MRQVSRPRDAAGRFVSIPGQQRSFRVQKNGGGGGGGSSSRRVRRRRRRTEVELTMYHAIRWSGMGSVVPNVSVVNREPLVRMPLPCTFGEGPGGKPDEEEEEDFAVGLSRELVREIEKMWAGRMKKVGNGA